MAWAILENKSLVRCAWRTQKAPTILRPSSRQTTNLIHALHPNPEELYTTLIPCLEVGLTVGRATLGAGGRGLGRAWLHVHCLSGRCIGICSGHCGSDGSDCSGLHSWRNAEGGGVGQAASPDLVHGYHGSDFGKLSA